jgi:hypothetical protein
MDIFEGLINVVVENPGVCGSHRILLVFTPSNLSNPIIVH